MAIALLVGCVLLQGAWIVDDDGGPGVDFTDLPAAVEAAADGDLLLVLSGSYSHFTLSGKGLALVANGNVRIDRPGTTGHTEIADVPVHSRVVLDGLEFPGDPDCGETRLLISGSSTNATLVDVAVTGVRNGCSGWLMSSALQVRSARVVLLRASLTGGPGFAPFPSTGGPGGCALLALDAARVHIVESTLHGGQGVAGYMYPGGGGPALFADWGSRVWIANSTLTGGSGSVASSGAFAGGGAGIFASNAARVRVSGDMDRRISGGSGGFQVGALGISASGGARVVVHEFEVWTGQAFLGPPPAPQIGGFVLAEPMPSLHIEGGSTWPGSVTISLVDGPANGPFQVWLERSAGFPVPAPVTPFLGELAFRPDRGLPLFSGSLSPDGDFSATVPLSLLGATLHRTARLQAVVGSPTTTMRLSSPVAFTPRAPVTLQDR